MTGTTKCEMCCTGCGRKFSFGTYTCPDNDGILLAQYDLPAHTSRNNLRDLSKPGIWQFARFLPSVDPISCAEGNTPLIPSRSIGPTLGIELVFKDEGRNPTGSFKDRAASVLLSVEKALGHNTCATATSGNAGGALALYSSLAGITCYTFCFHPTREKYIHMKSFGMPLLMVKSDKESEMTSLTEKACTEFGWARLTTMASANPFNVEGYKTIAYEIVSDGYDADVVVAPMTSGTLILGIAKGFRELQKMGTISQMPRIIGVQAAEVDPIARAYENNLQEVQPISGGTTIATGLVLDDPGICGSEALRAIRESQGGVVSIPEKEILRMTKSLPRDEGIFAEPSGATGIAGVAVACKKGLISQNERVVCVNSASGFKDLSVLENDEETTNVHHIGGTIEDVAGAVDLRLDRREDAA
jgi:threonine synthase